MSSKELILWRLTTASFWSVAIQFLFFVIIVFVINFNPWHPVSWIQHSISTCLSFGTWLYICPLALVIFAQGLICSKDYVVVKKYHGTRFTMICNMFSVHNLIMVGLNTVIGGIITWIHLSLLGGKYSNIITECPEHKTCLIEEYVFLLLNGFWIGLYFFMQSHFVVTNALSFPVVQQLKFLQIKAELQSLLKQAMANAVMPTLYFFLFYFWRGESVRNFVSGLFDCGINEDYGISGFRLINLHLLFYSWLSSATFILTMNTLKLLFQVHLTESVIFPVTICFGNSDALALHQALAMADLPIIQYLGFLDLKNLAEKSRSRREELFTLSQPGGHPYNWNAVVAECLKLVKTFTENLNKASIDTQPPVETKVHYASEEYFLTSNIVTSPTVLNTSGMRNLSLRTPVMPNISIQHTPNLQSTNITNIQTQRVPLAQILKSHIIQIVDVLCKKPGISFIFGELPDAKVRYHLAQAQPIIWTVQSMAHLSAASLKEDSYGVVQKDLPEILTAILHLKQTLDKLQKVGNYKKSLRTDYFEVKMKSALRSAVKHSLYCICIEFGDYMKELKLTKDVFQQLQPYLLFREG